MGHHSCCNQQKVNIGLWSPEEDEKLIRYITSHGYGCWSEVLEKAGLQICGKSCRLRWINYLRPDIRRGRFTPEEEKLIINLHGAVGNRWAHIASHLPGRTDNEIKNYWNSWIKKKIRKASHNKINTNQDSYFTYAQSQLQPKSSLHDTLFPLPSASFMFDISVPNNAPIDNIFLENAGILDQEISWQMNQQQQQMAVPINSNMMMPIHGAGQEWTEAQNSCSSYFLWDQAQGNVGEDEIIAASSNMGCLLSSFPSAL